MEICWSHKLKIWNSPWYILLLQREMSASTLNYNALFTANWAYSSTVLHALQVQYSRMTPCHKQLPSSVCLIVAQSNSTWRTMGSSCSTKITLRLFINHKFQLCKEHFTAWVSFIASRSFSSFIWNVCKKKRTKDLDVETLFSVALAVVDQF